MGNEVMQLANLLIQGGVCAVLLGVILWWLLYRWQPAMQKSFQDAIERICQSHETTNKERDAALEKNTDAVRGLAKANLVSTLVGAGVHPDEATRRAGEIVLNGSNK
jgi:hypothetical protein